MREIALEGAFKDIRQILESLMVYDGRIIFNNEIAPFIFSNYYAKFNREHWAGNEAKVRYHILAEILKIALSKNIISIKDIEDNDDYEILNLLEDSEDEQIIRELALLKNGFKINKDSGESGFFLRKKFRFVDPMIFSNEELTRLSEINLDYKKILAKDREEVSKEEKIIIVRN